VRQAPMGCKIGRTQMITSILGCYHIIMLMDLLVATVNNNRYLRSTYDIIL